MQAADRIPSTLDVERAAQALLAGSTAGCRLLLAAGEISYLEAALDAGLAALRA